MEPSSSSAAIVDALGPSLRAALREMAAILDVPLSRYPEFSRVPVLRAFEVVAALRQAEALRAEGRPYERALGEAAARLGVEPETARSARKRAGRAARDGRRKLGSERTK